MKKGLLFAALALIGTLFVASTLFVANAAAEDAATTMKGQFNWNDRTEGALEAVFTGIEEGKWNVAFHFDFRDEPHTYSGTAEGNLTEGELAGTVQNEDKKRTFTFKGTFIEGKFEGTHEETTPGRSRETGTMTLGD